MERYTVEEAELRVVFHGVSLAVERGFCEIWVESDSSVVVDLLLAGGTRQHPLSSIIEEINTLVNGFAWLGGSRFLES